VTNTRAVQLQLTLGHTGIKVYNSLPPEIEDLSHNIKKFKWSLRGFLHQHSFYTLEEYLNYKAVVWYILTTNLIFIIPSVEKKTN